MKLSVKQLLLIRKYLNGRTNFRFGGMDSDECSICLNDVHPRLNNKLGCGHKYCTQCLYKWIRSNNNYTCPYCRAEICDTDVNNINNTISTIGNNGCNYIRRVDYSPMSNARRRFAYERALEQSGLGID